ncbi:MAG: hypothetical protein AABZ36_05665, partial [Nitrospirota bacterium]
LKVQINILWIYVFVIPHLMRNPVFCMSLDSRFHGNDKTKRTFVMQEKIVAVILALVASGAAKGG